MRELHKEIIDRIAQDNANYKLQVVVRKRLTSNVGDFVMVKKMHAQSAGLLQILKKWNDNDYVIDLPKDF